jgi:tetratricopeptide (TPR) repeat protein
MPRWRVACDACDNGAWVGARPDGIDAWCEGCQRPARLASGVAPAVCAQCGQALTLGEPRFEELFGELQNAAAVLAAWAGDPAALGEILPERPRFLTDLNPVAALPDDSPTARAALDRLGGGHFAEAGAALEQALAESGDAPGPRGARWWHALGIAAQRTGQLSRAESAFAKALEHDPGHVAARLGRGALRARRGDFAGAREDFAGAGDGREARWNRAAVAVLEAVAGTPGLPDGAVLREARAEAGPASEYWSDHTVGRLLWTALVERALSRGGGDARCADERVLRAAEHELEFSTFWDRALVVHGYASVGMRREAAAAAAPLASDLLRSLGAEPCMRGPAGQALRAPLEEAQRLADSGNPGAARAALGSLMERADLRRYRVPCLHCGRGTVGVAAVEDDGVTEEMGQPA